MSERVTQAAGMWVSFGAIDAAGDFVEDASRPREPFGGASPMPSDPNAAPAVPDEVLEEMASAMLERRLGAAHATGNAVRKEVLKRALSTAESLGWSLRPKATPDMVAAGRDAFLLVRSLEYESAEDAAVLVFEAMLAAAPPGWRLRDAE